MLLLSCDAREDSSTMSASATDPQVLQARDISAWLGRWTGPEGTYLDVAVNAAAYSVTVSNLDGPRTFAATPAADGITFERDGVRESIRATDGPGTGMKWLQSKHDCIVIKPGEGFCRD
jgi:hypothetical protein